MVLLSALGRGQVRAWGSVCLGVVPGVTGERGAGAACVQGDGAPAEAVPGAPLCKAGVPLELPLGGEGRGPLPSAVLPRPERAASGGVTEAPGEQSWEPSAGGSSTELSNPLMESGSPRSSPHSPAKDGVHAPHENRCPDTGAGQDHLPHCASRVSRRSEDFAAGFPCTDAIFQGKLITLPSTGLPPTQGRAKAMGSQDQGPLRSEGGLPTETQNTAFLL